jgi:hypothetical protein
MAIVVAVVVILAAVLATAASRERYLIAPYLDLDAIGGRGSPYALTECDAR